MRVLGKILRYFRVRTAPVSFTDLACMAESEIGIVTCNGDTMAALYVAAQCQNNYDSDLEVRYEICQMLHF